MNLPSALSPQPSVSAPLPQPLHDFALHGFAKDRYAIQCSPIAGHHNAVHIGLLDEGRDALSRLLVHA